LKVVDNNAPAEEQQADVSLEDALARNLTARPKQKKPARLSSPVLK